MSKRGPLLLRHERTEHYLGRKRTLPLLKEEVWRDESGRVVKYSLAFIDPGRFAEDNGRVLGYDNGHGHHHRHFRGEQTAFTFTTYEALTERFEREVRQLLKEMSHEQKDSSHP